MQTDTYRYNCCMCLLLLQAIYTVNYFRTALFAVHGRLGLCSKKKEVLQLLLTFNPNLPVMLSKTFPFLSCYCFHSHLHKTSD